MDHLAVLEASTLVSAQNIIFMVTLFPFRVLKL